MGNNNNGEHREIIAAVGLVRDLVIETRAEGAAQYREIDRRLQLLDENQKLGNAAHHATATRIAVMEATCATRGKRISKLENQQITDAMLGTRVGVAWSAIRVVGVVVAWIAATAVALWSAVR